METLRKPIWLLLTNVLPQILLVYLFYVAFGVIETMLSDNTKEQWSYFCWYYAIKILFFGGYSAYLFVKKKTVPLWASWVIIGVNILSLTLHFYFTNELIPVNIPNWMLTSQDLEIYTYSFIVTGALYGLILLVIHFTKEETKLWISLGGAFGIPFLIYILFQLILFFDFDNQWIDNFKYLAIYLGIVTVCAFLFFLFRFVYVLNKRSDKSLKTVTRLFFCLLFPLGGLALNNHLFSDFAGDVFGYYNNPAFYLIALLNGIIMLLPSSKSNSLRLFQFSLKSSFFCYIVYFFIIFVPWLPLSIIAILAIGLGFLMLSPVLAFVIQVGDLRSEFLALKNHYSEKLLYGIGIVSFMLIPMVIAINFSIEKSQLNEAFDFLYDRSYSDSEIADLDTDRIKNVLNHIDRVKHHDVKQIPFIDSYYNWYVLDNLILSDAKLKQMREIFLGKGDSKINSWRRSWRNNWVYPANNAVLEKYVVESIYLPDSGYWKTWINMDLTTQSTNQVQYKAYLKTQPGTFISDYYLTIEDKKKHGILAEKRTAKWVYNNIVKTRRDPGLLEKIAPDNYSLFVYPVSSSLPRESGIQFIHKGRTTIQIDSTKIEVGKDTLQTQNNENYIYVSAYEKEQLKKTKRQNHYYVFVDWSRTAMSYSEDIKVVTENFLKTVPKGEVSLGLQNYEYQKLNVEDWKSYIYNYSFKGGFYPEYTIKRRIIDAYKKQLNHQPVFVLITKSIDDLKFLNGLKDIRPLAQELEKIYIIDKTSSQFELNLSTGKIDSITQPFSDRQESYVLKNGEENYYLNLTVQPELIRKRNNLETFNMDSSLNSNLYQEALALYELELQDVLKPEQDLWEPIVKQSFKNRLVSKFTSFISLETEAQEKMLLHKQKQVLNSNKNLDLEEQVQNMSEPSILWYLLALLGIFFIHYRKRFLTNF